MLVHNSDLLFLYEQDLFENTNKNFVISKHFIFKVEKKSTSPPYNYVMLSHTTQMLIPQLVLFYKLYADNCL